MGFLRIIKCMLVYTVTETNQIHLFLFDEVDG